MTSQQRLALKVASILWVIWGLVHALAGIMIISGDAISGFQAIGDAVDPVELEGRERQHHVDRGVGKEGQRFAAHRGEIRQSADGERTQQRHPEAQPNGARCRQLRGRSDGLVE